MKRSATRAGPHPASSVCAWLAERVARANAPLQHSWFITGNLKEPYLLSPDKIQQQLSHSLKAWTNVLSQEARDFICQYQMNNHSETISSLPVERIEHIVQAMWKTDSFHMNAAQFPSQLAALNDALLFSYAHCFPTIISLKNYRAKLSFLHTHIQNPLLEYYQERLIPQIKSFQPDLIGMSYSCSQ